MKNMITMMIGIVIGAITILIILTVTGRMNYATELESQLPAVVENILCNGDCTDRTGTMRRHFQHKPVRTWK